jgi:hypothetical protein
MYLLDEVTKEIQKDRLREAETRRLLKTGRQPGKLQAQLLIKLGDLLVANGLKLKQAAAPRSDMAWKKS